MSFWVKWVGKLAANDRAACGHVGCDIITQRIPQGQKEVVSAEHVTRRWDCPSKWVV